MTQVLIDNDVILKTCRWLLGSQARTVMSRHGVPAILGSARFVLSRRLEQTRDLPDIDAARKELQQFFAAASIVEPDDAAILLAADLQEAAQTLDLPLDSGESLLLAILVTRDAAMLITGDKRAITAAQAAATSLKCFQPAQRVACLEQLLSSVALDISTKTVREHVCADAKADTAVATCFGCWATSFREDEVAVALASYITDLRSNARDLLVDGNDLLEWATWRSDIAQAE